MIQISLEVKEQVEAILAGVPKGAERALSNALNRGLSKVKTGANKRVKEVYAVQAGALASATKTKIQNASGGNLVAQITFSGTKIALYKFSVTPKAPGTRQRVFATVKRGEGGTLDDAFIAAMRSGHTGVFEREGPKRFPIEEKMGLSMAQMVGNEKVIEEIGKEAQKTVNERIEHEIERLLSGYGG